MAIHQIKDFLNWNKILQKIGLGKSTRLENVGTKHFPSIDKVIYETIPEEWEKEKSRRIDKKLNK